jgi:hypothetical protein
MLCVCVCVCVFVCVSVISCESYLQHTASRRERHTLSILSVGVARIDFNKKRGVMSLSS